MPQLALGWVSYSTSASDRAVAQCGHQLMMRWPFVDQALVVQVYEYLDGRLGAALVHGEALAVPVAGGAELS